MAELHVLRVFVAPEGTGGNPLGVFLDGAAVPEGRRQAIATDLGFSETVFVDDSSAGAVRIFTPGGELPFAGHPLVGTSWLLARERTAVAVLRPPAGEVPTFLDTDGVTWIRGRAEWAPEMSLRQLAGSEQVDALDGGPDGLDFADRRPQQRHRGPLLGQQPAGAHQRVAGERQLGRRGEDPHPPRGRVVDEHRLAEAELRGGGQAGLGPAYLGALQHDAQPVARGQPLAAEHPQHMYVGHGTIMPGPRGAAAAPRRPARPVNPARRPSAR